MVQVRVVTDSGADLAPHGSHGVTIVPLQVHFGSSTYRDGVDLTPEAFYARLTASDETPRTSQPTPADFEQVYRRLVQDGATAILSYHLSSELSGTYQSAVLAARAVEGVRIDVVDTRSASMGVGLIALEAARMARKGHDADAILRETRSWIERLRVVFMVDTLTYLARNGRIGKAQAWAGGILHVKPILTLEDGVVSPLERVRGKAKAMERLVQRCCDLVGGRAYRAVVLHGAVPDQAETLRQRLLENIPDGEVDTAVLGPTIGSHAGPGTLGVVVLVC